MRSGFSGKRSLRRVQALRGTQEVLLRAVRPGACSEDGGCEPAGVFFSVPAPRTVSRVGADRETGFLGGLTLPMLMEAVAGTVAVYGLHAQASELRVPADMHQPVDSLILSHVSAELTDVAWFEAMWTGLLRNVRDTLVWDVYTPGDGSNALWDAFVSAVQADPFVPDRMELRVHATGQHFTQVITSVLARTQFLSVRLDGRSRGNVPLSVFTTEQIQRLEIGLDVTYLRIDENHREFVKLLVQDSI